MTDPRSLGSRASGASLALPAWIEFMATALKNVPVAEVLPPRGDAGGWHWRYTEWAEGGFVRNLGLDGETISPALAVRPNAMPLPVPPATTPSEARNVSQRLNPQHGPFYYQLHSGWFIFHVGYVPL
jgi:penicillin-binding protein 1A